LQSDELAITFFPEVGGEMAGIIGGIAPAKAFDEKGLLAFFIIAAGGACAGVVLFIGGDAFKSFAAFFPEILFVSFEAIFD
jgi:hypothetical protein